MAIYHLNAKVHGRGTDPKLHALRSYAYRSGTRIVDPITRRIYNYQSKQAEVVLTETLTPRDIIVPDWMRDGPQLWQRVMTMETAVRRDAQIFRELEMALPVELGIVESATLIRGFITEQLTDAGMVCSYSIHFKQGNPHVHIMATLRGIEIAGNDSDVSYDGNDNATDPIRFGHKNRDWNSKAMLGQWRKAWADHVNAALVKVGSDQRVTHQSFAAMGRQNEPTVHVGPDFKRGDGYQAKRVARLQSNEQVTQRNKQRGEQRRHAAHKALMAGVCGAKLSVALQSQNKNVEQTQGLEQGMIQALAPVHHLIDDMAALLHQVQFVANALERPLSSGALAKRVARILDAVPPPQNQAELQTALLAMEVVFAAKRRPQFVAAVLDAIPTEQRQHFENIVASVLGTTPMDAGHDMAALALSAANQCEVQAQWSIRQVLSDFQLADYPARCQAMAVIGKNYTWRDFEQDIQRFAHSDAGWQRAWWDEQVTSLTGEALADFGKVVPTWFEVGKPESPAKPERHTKTYPLGAYDPNPEQTLLAALKLHQVSHPVPAPDAPEVFNGDANVATNTNSNIWGGMPAGLVVAPQPIRTREVNNPWGITPDEAGGGTQPYSGSSGPTGW